MTVGSAYPLAGFVRVPILSCEVSLCDAAPETKHINTVILLYVKSKHYPQKVDKTYAVECSAVEGLTNTSEGLRMGQRHPITGVHIVCIVFHL